MITKKIGIIGCGNMGEAIFSRLANFIEPSTSIMVSELDAKRRALIQERYKIIVQTDNNYLVKNSDVIIICVKPKDFDELLRDQICCGLSEGKLLISIAAGITTKHIERIVGRSIPVIRAMPNMPALVGEAITSISAGSTAEASHVETAGEIFSAIGDVVVLDERLVDSVTAISGSGPAYFFYLAAALIKAGKELGLDGDTARRLVLKTALGSSKLLDASKEDIEDLIKRIASKGGTTEAALDIFEKRKLQNIIRDAVKKASARSKELSGG